MLPVSIWTPVVLSQLNDIKTYSNEISFSLDGETDILEDIKIRVKLAHALMQGKSADIQIKLDVICLVSTNNKTPKLINKEIIIKERLASNYFSKDLNQITDNCTLTVDIKNIEYDVNLNSSEICIIYQVKYMVIAVANQIIKIDAIEQIENVTQPNKDEINELREENRKLYEENQILKRNVNLYERNEAMLKIGINKTEKRNAQLNKEILQYEKMLTELRQEILHNKAKQNNQNNYSKKYTNNQKDDIGVKIKKLFLSSV